MGATCIYNLPAYKPQTRDDPGLLYCPMCQPMGPMTAMTFPPGNCWFYPAISHGHPRGRASAGASCGHGPCLYARILSEDPWLPTSNLLLLLLQFCERWCQFFQFQVPMDYSEGTTCSFFNDCAYPPVMKHGNEVHHYLHFCSFLMDTTNPPVIKHGNGKSPKPSIESIESIIIINSQKDRTVIPGWYRWCFPPYFPDLQLFYIISFYSFYSVAICNLNSINNDRCDTCIRCIILRIIILYAAYMYIETVYINIII